MNEGLPEWFFKKLELKNECWEWVGSKGGSNDAYGVVSVFHKQQYAHRLAWYLVYGELPTGGDSYHYRTLQVCHHCDNPPCCRPSHLFVGTPSDNFNDCLNKKRRSQSHPGRSGKIKLNETIVREIRLSSESSSVIARRLGVTRECIYAVRKRRVWKHIIP